MNHILDYTGALLFKVLYWLPFLQFIDLIRFKITFF